MVMHHVVFKWNGVDLAGLVHALGDEPEGGWPPDLSAAGSIKATSFKNQLNPRGLQDWLDDDGDTTVLQPSIMVGADVVLKTDAGWLVVLTLKLYSSSIKRDAFNRNVATSNLFDCYTTTAGKPVQRCSTLREATQTLLSDKFKIDERRRNGRCLVRIVVTLPGPSGNNPDDT